jgi:hypothetical protein
MSTATTAKEIGRDAELTVPEGLLREVRDHLRGVLRSLNQEIRAYPTPIPRCDAQFNHLVEQRSRLYLALERIEPAADGALSHAQRLGLLEEFAASPSYLEAAPEEEIRSRIRVELSRLVR